MGVNLVHARSTVRKVTLYGLYMQRYMVCKPVASVRSRPGSNRCTAWVLVDPLCVNGL